MKYIKLLTIVILISSTIYSQSIPELVTDRPDQTESSVTVPKGWLQIETGILMEGDSPMDNVDLTNTVYNTTLLRYGLFDKTELRFGWEYLQEKWDNDGIESDVTGLVPLVIGFKTQISEEDGWIPELAFLGHLTIPNVGEEDFQADYLTPDFRFAGTKTLNDRFSAAFNLGGEWDGVLPNTNIFYSVVVGMGLSEKIGAFAEVYGYVIEDCDPDHRFDAGATYLINNNFQLDISGGVGINEKAPDYFISGGLSYRLNLKK